MEQLLDLLLGGGLRLPFFDADLFDLDQSFPKTDLIALLMLQRRGEATMSELASDLGAPLSTATGVGARLSRRGLVERRRAEEDRRVVVVRLTPDGQELAARIRSQVDRLLARLQEILTPEELTQLISLVFKIIQGFQNPGSGSAGTGVRRIPIED